MHLYIIENTKTDAETRKIPITEVVAQMFRTINEDKKPPKTEELKRMEEFQKAQVEIKEKNDAKALSQKMLKVV